MEQTPDMQSHEPIFDEAMLLEVLENQLADNHPIRVKETLLRLSLTGHSREEAMSLMACALAAEILAMEQESRSFDESHYAALLASLPEMPWAEE
ncbi:MAG: hypothetical protein ACRCRW_13135 [Aeromonadaceae bacterium]